MTPYEQMRQYAEAIIAIADAQMPVGSPPSTWLYTLNGAAPFYGADFVSGDYYAAGAVQPTLAAFLAAAGFAGSYSVDADGLDMGASINKVSNSNDFSSWSKANVTVANGVITDTAVNGLHEMWAPVSVVAGSANTYAFEAKADTLSKLRLWGNKGGVGIYADVDLIAGTIVSGVNTAGTSVAMSNSLTPLADGYSRITISGVVGNNIADPFIILSLRDANGSRTYTGNGGRMFIRKAQVQSGGAFTAYQENVGGTTSLIKNTITAPTAITRIIHAKTGPTLPADLYQVLHHLDNNVNTATGYSDIEDYRGANGNIFIECKKLSNTAVSGLVDVGNVPNNASFKLAYTASPAGIIHSFNGGTPVTTPISAWPDGLTFNRLNGNMSNIRQWGGSLARDVLFFGTATPEQLQAMSA